MVCIHIHWEDTLIMETARRAPEASPEQKLAQMHFSFAPSRIVSTALQLDFFSHLAAGKKTAAEVAKAAGASARGTRMILDALVGFELLSKHDGQYQLAPPARQFYVRGSPDYMGYIMEDDSMWEAWSHLTECVRTGKPSQAMNLQERGETFFPTLVRGLHVMNREPARRLAQVLDAGNGRRGLCVLDVACGSGVWGIAMAEADPEARITAQDFPSMFDVTKQFIARHGVADRFDFLAGDLRQVDFGEARYDVVILGNIVHSEGERSSRDLLQRSHRALKSGGRVAILDMIPNDTRSAPPFPLIFAINMLVNTEEGDTYTHAEYAKWLTEAGFAKVEIADVASHSPAIIGTRG
jgi:ubiquinone/menaquinone biosynthesis C-methylase UbiE